MSFVKRLFAATPYSKNRHSEWASTSTYPCRLALSLLTVAFGGCGGTGGTAPGPSVDPGESTIHEIGGQPPGMRLVWSDEFDTSGLPDPARWGYDTARNAAGWYNNELQYYAAGRQENSRVEGGQLILTAQKEDLSALGLADWGGQAYSSARLITRGKGDWREGFIEVRAKLPCGRGTWPAIWTLSSPPRTQWPADGEIDIMEHVGHDQGRVHATVHTSAYNHAFGNAKTSSTAVPDACSAFHRYQLTWTAERIVIGVDDRNYYQYRNDLTGRASWPFDGPQHLILNIAVGGDWGGQKGVDDSIWPVQMVVDYVRVYQP